VTGTGVRLGTVWKARQLLRNQEKKHLIMKSDLISWRLFKVLHCRIFIENFLWNDLPRNINKEQKTLFFFHSFEDVPTMNITNPQWLNRRVHTHSSLRKNNKKTVWKKSLVFVRNKSKNFIKHIGEGTPAKIFFFIFEFFFFKRQHMESSYIHC
jgi:hypothetical protein